MQSRTTSNQAYAELLRVHNMRDTKAKRAIYKYLSTSHQPVTIQTITKHVSDVHFVNIYRAMDSLQKAGVVRIVPQGFKTLYELSEIFTDHHHHATCEQCGATVAIHDESLEASMHQLIDKLGYTQAHHQFEIHGICDKCSVAK